MPGRTNVRSWVKVLVTLTITECMHFKGKFDRALFEPNLSFDRLLYKRHLLHQAIKTRN